MNKTQKEVFDLVDSTLKHLDNYDINKLKVQCISFSSVSKSIGTEVKLSIQYEDIFETLYGVYTAHHIEVFTQKELKEFVSKFYKLVKDNYVKR